MPDAVLYRQNTYKIRRLSNSDRKNLWFDDSNRLARLLLQEPTEATQQYPIRDIAI